MLKVGFIGLGQMGKQHLVDCLHMKQAKVVAAADPSKKALNQAKTLGVANLYDDYVEMLNKEKNNLDAVVISVPNFLHFDAICNSLEAGINVFVEKPLAVNVEQCKQVVKKVESSGRKFMIGHSARYIPAVEKIKADINRGIIGDLEVATIEEVVNGPFSHPRNPAPVPEWWFDKTKSGGGVLTDIGYHMIDLFRFFTEDEVTVSFADLSFKYGLPVEEGALVVLKTIKDSIKGFINVGWYQRSIFPKFNFRAIIHGDSGYLSTEELIPKNLYGYAAKQGMKNIGKRLTGKAVNQLSYTYYWEAYFKEMNAFFESITKDVAPPTTAIDGLKTMQIIEDAYKLYERTNGGVNQ
jgi:myo-inositol 2-dehydrogenase / D-chiro-inositol 1-dehydrogenase